MSPKTWPSALLHVTPDGEPSDTPTGKTHRYDLIELWYGFEVSTNRRFIRMMMQSTALKTNQPAPANTNALIEIDAFLIDPPPKCFAEDVPWFESANDVFRLGQPVEEPDL